MVNQKKFAKWLKRFIRGMESKLDKEFGINKWPHWVRIDDTGSSLPSADDYKKLKEILHLPDEYDEKMLTTVKVLVDDKGSKLKQIGWTKCNCGIEFKGGIVLDPFIGSGTTGVVAKQLGLNFIGVELNPKYCEIAKKRIGNVEIVKFEKKKVIKKEEKKVNWQKMFSVDK